MTDNTAKNKVEQKRVRGKNAHSVITQIVEKYNASEGWAVKKVNMQVVNNLEVYLERSVEQGDNKSSTTSTKDTKVETDEKAKEEVVETDKSSEKQDEVTATTEEDTTTDKPKQTRSTRSRAKSK